MIASAHFAELLQHGLRSAHPPGGLSRGALAPVIADCGEAIPALVSLDTGNPWVLEETLYFRTLPGQRVFRMLVQKMRLPP